MTRDCSVYISKLKQIKHNVLDTFNTEIIGVFGSYARGNYRPDSDIDLLVRFGKHFTLLDLPDLENYLEKQLEKKIDLVSIRSLKPSKLKNIRKDMISL